MDHTAKTRISTRVGPLDVHQVGNGPVALLWHSLFIDSRSWMRIESDLSAHRQLVLIDGPGHGGSGDPGHRYTMADCAIAATEVLDALGVTERVDWVGNAWGGHVGIVASTDGEDRLRSLVALGTPVRSYRPAERRQVQFLTLAYQLLGPADFLTRGVAEVQLSAATLQRDPEAVALTTEFLRNANRGRLRNAIESISLGRDSLESRLPQISVPTLFVTGSDHSGFTPAEARATITHVPGGRVEVVDDAAYLIPLEQPGPTTELILDFWQRL